MSILKTLALGLLLGGALSACARGSTRDLVCAKANNCSPCPAKACCPGR
jgi:hypothetical protein